MFLESLSGAKPPEDGVENPLYDEEDGDGEASGMAGDGAGGGQEDGEEANFCTAWLLCVGSGTAGCLLAKVRSAFPSCASGLHTYTGAKSAGWTRSWETILIGDEPVQTLSYVPSSASLRLYSRVTGESPRSVLLNVFQVTRRIYEACYLHRRTAHACSVSQPPRTCLPLLPRRTPDFVAASIERKRSEALRGGLEVPCERLPRVRSSGSAHLGTLYHAGGGRSGRCRGSYGAGNGFR